MRREATPSDAFKDALLRRMTGAPAPRFAFRFAAVGMVALVLLFGVGTGVYAYESPEVVEGHPLYFMKHGLEAVEGQLVVTPEGRARYHSRMMGRRMDEAERFADRQEMVGVLLESATQEFDRSVEDLERNGPESPGRGAVIQQLGEHNRRYEHVLQRVPIHEGRGRPLPPPEAIRERLDSLIPNAGPKR